MKDDKLLQHDPLSDADLILRDDFYGRRPTADAPTPRRKARSTAARPTHYKVICISMYTRDIEELEAKVAELKKRGWTKANKSQLIRMALSQINIDTLTPPTR